MLFYMLYAVAIVGTFKTLFVTDSSGDADQDTFLLVDRTHRRV